MHCPRCDSWQLEGSLECRQCGVVFAKLSKPGRGPLSVASAAEVSFSEPPGTSPFPRFLPPEVGTSAPIPLQAQEIPEPLPFEKEGWIALGIGLGLALVLPLLPLLNFLLHPILTLTHELGHAAFAWLFGYPAIPSFDFIYGGGLTHWSNDRHAFLLVLPLGGLGWALYNARGDRGRLSFWLILLAVYLVLAFRLHWLMVLYMGHGTTLLIAGIFLYRALGGRSLVHQAERPLYAFLGWWMVFRELTFSYGLLTNPAARLLYREGKGGVLPNDFVRIAESSLRVPLKSVARFHLLACVLIVVLAFLAHRYRNHLIAGLHWAFGVKEGEQSRE